MIEADASATAQARGPRNTARRRLRKGPTVAPALVALLLVAAPAAAFDSKGHNVVEALAYRTLAEGYGGQPARPDVLRDLLNDGALEPPYCFGAQGSPTRLCTDAPEENPLLLWPRPRTDRPDAFFRRQFSDPGQCFHYMAMLADSRPRRRPRRARVGRGRARRRPRASRRNAGLC